MAVTAVMITVMTMMIVMVVAVMTRRVHNYNKSSNYEKCITYNFKYHDIM